MMTVSEVQNVSRRGENWVRGAANTGALKSLPRRTGQWFRFLEEGVADWIRQGSPEFPAISRSRPRRVSWLADLLQATHAH